MPTDSTRRYPKNFIGKDGLPRYATPEQRAQVYLRDDGRCVYCGKKVSFDECVIDHLIPWPKGPTAYHNLFTACPPCNKAKGRFDINAHNSYRDPYIDEPLGQVVEFPRRRRH